MLDSQKDEIIMQMGLAILAIGIQFAKVLLDHPELLKEAEQRNNTPKVYEINGGINQ